MSIELVREFMTKSGQEIAKETLDISENLSLFLLRWSLLYEEVKEFKENGIDERNIVEVADALGDIQYVLDGAFLALGIDKDSIFDEVHRSNMTKFPATQDIAEQSVEFYAKKGRETHWEKRQVPNSSGTGYDSWYVILDSNTKKVLKSIEWDEPQIEKVLATLA